MSRGACLPLCSPRAISARRPPTDLLFPSFPFCRSLSRIGQVEQRLGALEETTAHSHALVTRQHAQSNGSAIQAAQVSDHERRIAQLEAQLYALQLAAARQPPPLQQQQMAPMYSQPGLDQGQQLPSLSSSTTVGPYGYSAPSLQHQQQQQLSSPYTPGGAGGLPLPAGTPQPQQQQQDRFDSLNPSVKHEADGNASFGAEGNASNGDEAEQHREKRWKGDPLAASGQLPGVGPASGEPDFISRGVVSEEEAIMCFESCVPLLSFVSFYALRKAELASLTTD